MDQQWEVDLGQVHGSSKGMGLWMSLWLCGVLLMGAFDMGRTLVLLI